MGWIALSGMMASGKTTAAKELEAAGFVRRSFGDLVRAEAQVRDLGSDRVTLQDLGQELFHVLGPVGMVERLIAGSPANLVLDGVRHVAVLAAIKERRPDAIAVFLTAGAAQLDGRWQARGDGSDRGTRGEHAVERELHDLRNLADLVIATSQFDPLRVAAVLRAAAA